MVKAGYKQTEVGVIPEDWELKTLAELALYTNGKAHESSVSDSGRYIIVNSKFISTDGLVKKFTDDCFLPTDKGDILLVMSDVPNGRAIARCFYVDRNNHYTVNQRICLLRPTQVAGRLLYYKLNRNPFYLAFDDGAKQTNLRKDDVLSCPLAIPPTQTEQQAIAGALSDVDELIGSLEKLIAKKRAIKTGTMQQLLTGKQRLPGFKGEWETKLLPEISLFRGGKAHEQHIEKHAQYICVNSKFISTEGAVRKYSTANFCSAKKDDVLMVMSDLPNGKALAKAYLVECGSLYAVNQRVCALTVFENHSPQFVFYVLNRNPYFLKFNDGVSQTHLLNRVFQKCPVLLPPTKPEEQAIATVLSDMDAEIQTLETKLVKTKSIKQGMMSELLTGETRLV